MKVRGAGVNGAAAAAVGGFPAKALQKFGNQTTFRHMNIYQFTSEIGQFLADLWKIGASAFLVYTLIAAFTLNIKRQAVYKNGYKLLTAPLGAWMMFPIAAILFPTLSIVSLAFAIVLMSEYIKNNTLTSQQWAQLTLFTISVPLYAGCTISFFRWCIVRRRYDDIGFEWGMFKFNRRIQWADVVGYRLGELRGLELRLKNGRKLKMTLYLNGLPELSQMLSNRLAVNKAETSAADDLFAN